jgi:galactose mutarotase-like enzyme
MATMAPLARTGLTRIDGHEAHVLRAGSTSFTVVPALGLLGASLRDGRREYLDTGGGIERVRAGHTTGLPLLAPWANRLGGDTYRVGRRTVELGDAPGLHREANGLAIHGTMVGRPGWRVERVGASRGVAGLRAAFDAGADPEVMASFPFPHRIEVAFRVRPGALVVTTSVVPTGRVRVPVSFGWHPYFRLPGEDLVDLRLRLPAVDRLELDARMLPTGASTRTPAARSPLAPGGHDDGFRFAGTGRFLALEGRRRAVTVTMGPTYPYGQVYAPPASTVVALEPMTAATDALGSGTAPSVAPGQRFAARFRITVS